MRYAERSGGFYMLIYAHDLEYLSDMAWEATSNYRVATKGQLASFEDFGLTDTRTTPRVKKRDLELNGRLVCRDTDPVYASETRYRRTPNPMIDHDDFLLCSWRRAINALSEEQHSWIKYCYGYSLKFDHQVNISVHIWSEFEKQHKDKKITKKVKERLRSLVWLSVQVCTGRDYAQTDLARLVGVERNNWKMNYELYWDDLLDICYELDKQALLSMGRTRSSQISKNKYYNLQK
ncbi:bacteriophage antitermination protein Q [Providencia sp.]|uniref:bacteriophage antitermination protein Q n=1 Tax=Providencia sp. TaxID=589 RepID=UPI003F9A7AFC